jgi:serine/threonine protein kinase
MPPGRIEADSDERLGEAIASFLREADAGRPPDRKAFLSKYPDLEDELLEFLSNLDHATRLSGPLRDLAFLGQDAWKGPRFGSYEIQGEIARGGMGVVYRARQAGLNRTVALKMIRAARLATEEDLERFRMEAKAAASLSHPNIVPIYDFGEHEGQQFYTMELIEGHTLDRCDCDFRSRPREAARLIALVARAVHHAHQRRIIHRDLKPGNILVDDAGEPHVTDFGLAMKTETGERLTDSNILLGTLPYMAPEQLSDQGQTLTTAVDIWSLGVILYELLTGRQPFRGRNQVDSLDRIRKQDPTPPGVLNRNLQRDLEAICLKCLEKEPERRYGSALGVARDLERWLEGQPIEARAVHPFIRMWSWCRRHPGGAALGMAAALFLAATGTGVAFRLAEKRAHREGVIQGLVYTARFVADEVLHRFSQWGEKVTTSAQDSGLIEALKEWRKLHRENSPLDPPRKQLMEKAREKLERCCEAFRQADFGDPGVQDWFLLDPEGTLLARAPSTPNVGENYQGRDYFKGLLLHPEGSDKASVHVSSAFRASVDKCVKFVICRRIEDGSETLGVVAVAIGTHSTMGLRHIHDDQHRVALVAPWDPYLRANDPEMLWKKTPAHVLFLHPGYQNPGENPVAIDFPGLSEIGIRKCGRDLFPPPFERALGTGNYADPFSERDTRYAGRWRAGLAPVGNTGFLVIVQQRED